MAEATIFNNEKFGSIRALTIDNEPWFAGKDVATALGFKNTKDALASHVDPEDKTILQRSENATLENHIPKDVLPVNFVLVDIPNRGLTIINESGLYSLILSSKLPTAKAFKHWVTSEVLPTIRKTGQYHQPKGKELLALALIEANKTIQSIEIENRSLKHQVAHQTERIIDMTPKATFAERVISSKDTISMNELACLITQNGYAIGRNTLFNWMRENGYFFKTAKEPKQKYIKDGLFQLGIRPYGKDRVMLSRATRVTGKGQYYFLKKFLPEKETYTYLGDNNE